MKSRHALVAGVVLVVAGIAFVLNRARPERPDALQAPTLAAGSAEPTSARLQSPSEPANTSSTLAEPDLDSARVSQTEEVRWAHVEVTGTIVDDNGAFVRDATVVLLARRTGAGSGEDELVLAQHSTPASGRFELQASMPKREFLVEASHPDHRSARSDVLCQGVNEVNLVLPTLTGSIAGRVLVDPRIELEQLLVSQSYELPIDRVGRITNVKADGTFLLENVREGSSMISVNAREQLESIALVESVQVRRNETTHDPRLEPLDLRDILHRYDLHVVDRSGQPVRSGRVSVIAGPTHGQVLQTHIQGGYVRFTTALDCVDVELSAPDFRDQTVKCVSGDREVVMSDGIAVRVMLDNVPGRDPEQEILVELVTRENGPVQSSKSLQDDDSVTFRIGAPGWYGVRARLNPKWMTLQEDGSPNRAASRGTMLSGKQFDMFQVLDVPGEQFFRVALPPATERDARLDEDR